MKTDCSIEILQSALAGDLPADSETLLAEHLETCPACAARLDELAGGDDLCREAATLLAEDELDAAMPIGEGWSEIDFVVEHLEPADEPDILGRLGGYDVLEVVGRGGMGVVLKGFDRSLKRCVAIKVLAPHLAQSSLARQRFAREAQAAAAVVHPHVLAIHQVQPQGRLPFLVMPLVAGQSLAERLAAQGTLELREILRVAMQAAAGLAAAHEQGLVHRDVKPANILLETGVERAVLTDFGLARAADDVALTRQGIIAGTPEYMSPEQARGEPLDGRSDLFSLGSVIYEMASGVSPFRADSTVATIRRLVDEAPRALESRNPELPPWFTAIVARLLTKNPADRFASAKELSQLLEGCLAHVQQPANVPLPAGLPRWRRRLSFRRPALGRPSKRLITGVLVMFTALAAGVLGLVLAADVPDISGRWSGDDWGAVELTKTSGGAYTGTYSETLGKQPGELAVKWSKVERRFNGTWHEGKDRFGQISLRLAGDEIRGAFTTDAKSRLNPGTPALADLLWTRADRPAGELAQAGREPAPAGQMESILVAAVDLHYNDELTRDKVRFEEWPIGRIPLGAITRLDEIRGRRSAAKLFNGEPVVTGKLLAADGNASARLAGAAARGPELTIPLGQVQKLAYSPDGRLLGAADWGLANVYDAQTGELKTRLVLPEDPATRLAGESNAFCGSSLAFSPDSQLVAVGQGGRWVHLFEHSGRQIFRIEHRGATAIAFSPDGSLLATGGPSAIEVVEPGGESHEATLDATLKLWDAKTGELKFNLSGKNGSDVRAIAFSPDGKLLISAGERVSGQVFSEEGMHLSKAGWLEFWNPQTGKRAEKDVAFDNPAWLLFSPDGSRLAIGTLQPTSDTVDLHSRSGSIDMFYPANHNTQSIAREWMPGPLMFSPDGQLVGYFRDPRHFQWSDTSTGKLVQGIELPDRNNGDGWECFALAPAGDLVAISGRVDGKAAVRVWRLAGKPDGASPSSAELPTRNRRQPPTAATPASEIFTDQPVKVVAYSPDGKTLAIGGGGGMARLYDARTGEARANLALFNAQEESAFVLKGASWEKMVAGISVSAIAFSPDSAWVAVAYGGDEVKLFDARNGERLLQIVTPAVDTLAFSPDGSLLATGALSLAASGADGASDGTLKMWDAKTGELKFNLNGKEAGSIIGVGGWGSIRAIAFSPGGHLLASAGGWASGAAAGMPQLVDGVEFWNLHTGRRTNALPIEVMSSVHSLAFSADGSRLAVTGVHGDRGEMKVYDAVKAAKVDNGKAAYDFTVDDVLPGQVAFSADGKAVVALNSPRSLGFWGASYENDFEFEIVPPADSQGDRWNCFAFAPAGDRLATGGVVEGKNGVRIWNLASRGDEGRHAGEPNGAPPEAVPPLSTRLLSTAPLTLPPATPGLKILVHEPVKTLAYSPDGNLLAMAGDRANMFNFRTGKTLALALLSDEEKARLDQPASRPATPHDTMISLAFSPDSRRVAVAKAGWIKLFDAHSGEQLLRMENLGVSAIAFSPDGKQLAAGNVSYPFSADGKSDGKIAGIDWTLTLWDAKTGEMQRRHNGASVTAVAFSPDGQRLASAGLEGVEIDRADSGAQINAFPIKGANFLSIAFSPQGDRLLLGGERGGQGWIELIDRVTGNVEWERTRGLPARAAFSPDGRLVGSLDNSSRFILSDASSGEPLGLIEPGHSKGVTGWQCFAFAPDGKQVALGGGDDGGQGVHIWNLAGEPDAASPDSTEPPGSSANAAAAVDDRAVVALVTSTQDKTPLMLNNRLDLTLDRPRYVLLGIAQYIDLTTKATSELPELGFYFVSPEQVADSRAQISWDFYERDPVEADLFLQLKGEIGGRVAFDNSYRVGGKKPGKTILGSIGSDPVATHWRAIQPTGPALEITAGQASLTRPVWQTLRIFDALNVNSVVMGSIQLKLRACPILPGARIADTVPTLKGGDWRHDEYLAKLIGPADPQATADPDDAGPDQAVAAAAPRTVPQIHSDAPPYALSFSPDDKLLAVTSGRVTIGLYQATTGEPIRTIKFLTDEEEAILAAIVSSGRPPTQQIEALQVGAAVFSPDSSLLAVANSIGQVKLFDVQSGQLVRALDGVDRKAKGDKPLNKFLELPLAQGTWAGLAFSPDGALLATAGSAIDYVLDGQFHTTPDNTAGLLKLWDARTGALKHDLTGGHTWTIRVAFSADGKLLASLGMWQSINGTRFGVKFWDLQSAKVVHVVEITDEDIENPWSLALSPDGKHVALGLCCHDRPGGRDMGVIQLRSVDSGLVEQRWTTSLPVAKVAFSFDGKLLAARSNENTLTLWDPSTGRPRHIVAAGLPEGIVNVWNAPDDSRSGDRKNQAAPLLVPTGAELNTFALGSKSNRAALGGVDGQGRGVVSLWDFGGTPADGPGSASAKNTNVESAASGPAGPVSARSVLEIHADGPLGPIAYSADGKMLAVGGGKGPLVIYDAQSGQPKTKITPVDEKEEALLKSLSFMGGGMGGGMGNEGFQVGVWALAFSPDSARLAVGTGAGQVKLFDAATGKFELAIGDPVIKAGIEVPEDLRPLMRIAHGHVSGVAFSPDGKLLATNGLPAVGYNQGLWEPLRLWDAKTGKPKPGFRGEHNATTEAIAFSRDGKLLAAAGRWTVGKETIPGVKLRDAATGEVLTAIPMLTGGDQDQPLSVDFSPDGRRLAFAQTRYDNQRDVTDAGVWLLEVPSGLVKFSAKVPRIYTKAAFSGDGKLLAAFSGAARLTIWQTGRHMASSELAPPEPEAGEQWNTLAFDPSSPRLAIVGLDGEKKGLVRVWEFAATPAAGGEAPKSGQ